MTHSSSDLLHWYDQHRRSLPWRFLPGEKPDPYHVWLSEIMLQQTTVKTVEAYYKRFLKKYPSIHELAAAPLEDILQLWAGLGYYARARNLHACAKVVSELGSFPSSVTELIKLPGIGKYTANAIASIAFGVPVVPVDGNVERITSRVFAITAPLPQSRSHIAEKASSLNNSDPARKHPSDFSQALFDLGATICTPKNPSCLMCPWQSSCQGHKQGIAASLPKKTAKKPKPIRYGVYFIAQRANDTFLLRQRPPKGLLACMDEPPGTEWRTETWEQTEALKNAPFLSSWTFSGKITHIFSHFTLLIDVYVTNVPERSNTLIDPVFGAFRPLETAALPGVIQKCFTLVGVDVEKQ
ncbi:A/G-specific adenine glycosylase [Swingsia samuiensis]|uniref:Adenine DNA glycosylase n=1 Tax=Swingsia samuiensis TaxID=1293412 RepID=A0A4Y6UKK7_9PROT|nr:A/G-specific adenine glycosylase [Swingsia samuiensis]QDH16921.1 A/G-specific adenine glycosylase [Swingsia samuiensis]